MSREPIADGLPTTPEVRVSVDPGTGAPRAAFVVLARGRKAVRVEQPDPALQAFWYRAADETVVGIQLLEPIGAAAVRRTARRLVDLGGAVETALDAGARVSFQSLAAVIRAVGEASDRLAQSAAARVG